MILSCRILSFLSPFLWDFHFHLNPGVWLMFDNESLYLGQTELSIAYHDANGACRATLIGLYLSFSFWRAQAGLSWETILKKRQEYRLAFDNFDVRR